MEMEGFCQISKSIKTAELTTKGRIITWNKKREMIMKMKGFSLAKASNSIVLNVQARVTDKITDKIA